MTLVDEAATPSGRTPACLTTHRSAVAAPGPLAEAPLGVELPGPDAAGQRVPADPLRDRHHRLALMLDRERADQEVPVLRPLAMDPDLGVGRVVDPVADHPFEFPEPIVRADQGIGFLADAREEPSAVALDEEHACTGGPSRASLAGVMTVCPSSLATSGLRNRIDATSMAIFTPGLAANVSANRRSIRSRPGSARPRARWTSASSVKRAASALLSPRL